MAKTTQEKLLAQFVPKIKPLLELAKTAYGSRNIDSPQHTASRQYTKLLVQYHNRGGELPAIARALEVTYPGVRRRVMTAPLEASSNRPRTKLPQKSYDLAVKRILKAKESGDTHKYHLALYKEYEENGLSLAKIADQMGLSSANPLYYGVNKIRLEREQEVA